MATPLSDLQQAIVDALSAGDSIRLVPVRAIRGAGKKSRAGSASFSRALNRLTDRNLITLCRLRVAGPSERATHMALTNAGRALAAAAERPHPAKAPAPQQPATAERPTPAPAAQAVAATVGLPNERPRSADTPARAQRRCYRCHFPVIHPDDPQCWHCFGLVDKPAWR